MLKKKSLLRSCIFHFSCFFFKKRSKEKILMNKINQSVNLQLKSSFPKFHFFTHGGSFFVQKIKFKLLRVRIFFRIRLKNVYRSRLDMYAFFFFFYKFQFKQSSMPAAFHQPTFLESVSIGTPPPNIFTQMFKNNFSVLKWCISFFNKAKK